MEVAVFLRDAGFDRMLLVNNLSGKALTATVKLPADLAESALLGTI